jgi:hypothetical protein
MRLNQAMDWVRGTNQIIDNAPDLIRDSMVVVRIVGEDLVNRNLRCNKKLRFALIAGCAKESDMSNPHHLAALTVNECNESSCLLATLSNRFHQEKI